MFLLRLCLSIIRLEFVRQKKNKYTFLLETECSTFHSASSTTVRGSECLFQMFNTNIYFLNQSEVLPVLSQESK